jgi:hypothetical protein
MGSYIARFVAVSQEPGGAVTSFWREQVIQCVVKSVHVLHQVHCSLLSPALQ